MKNTKRLIAMLIVTVLMFSVCGVSASAATQYSSGKVSNPFRNAEIGDIVYFGHYEQDDNFNNGKEDIAWLVLERNKDRVLVLSQYALDCRPYNGEYCEITWEYCDLRSWLNDEFLDAAFSADEQSLILLADVSADKNPQSNARPGRTTRDKAFVLSIKEVKYYFPTKYDRFCKVTKYAIAQGSKVYRGSGTCCWWTRSPGCDNYYVTDIYGDGKINYIGGTSEQDYVSVRPAIWVTLAS